tara:strand:- start:4822 stop:5397 length:576 start_codon:yes stop_codon:yes gene_type:complete
MTKFIIVLTLIINTNAISKEFNKAYFGGGCFWCMEESFEKVEGVIDVISGYSGGKTNNPTYREVTYGDSGHFETVEVIFDHSKTDYETLLKVFWVNIDPFDALGQFCDKGYSYRSVAFYQNENQKKLIDNSILSIEKKFNQEVVTYVKEFKIFYKAEDNHQNYYNENFINYLLYKNACGRDNRLNKIWKNE